MELLYTAGGLSTAMDNSLAVFQQVLELPYDPAIPLPGTHPRELKDTFTQKLVQKVEATHMSITG